MSAVEQLKRTAKMLKVGEIGISDAESIMDKIIAEETVFSGEPDALDKYIEKLRNLKRKKYYLLLDATRR